MPPRQCVWLDNRDGIAELRMHGISQELMSNHQVSVPASESQKT
jgi:hypothetical protein